MKLTELRKRLGDVTDERDDLQRKHQLVCYKNGELHTRVSARSMTVFKLLAMRRLASSVSAPAMSCTSSFTAVDRYGAKTSMSNDSVYRDRVLVSNMG